MSKEKLISVNVLKEWVRNWFYLNEYYCPNSKVDSIPLSELNDILDRIEAIDAVPVEWINKWLEAYKQGYYDALSEEKDNETEPN